VSCLTATFIPIKGLIKNIHAYTKRAFQCQQNVAGKALTVAHQLAFDFMGVEQNAYSLYFAGTTEESTFETAVQNKQLITCRYICQKRKVRSCIESGLIFLWITLPHVFPFMSTYFTY
jgi:hypothetical protein